jgi:hypothetical protein
MKDSNCMLYNYYPGIPIRARIDNVSYLGVGFDVAIPAPPNTTGCEEVVIPGVPPHSLCIDDDVTTIKRLVYISETDKFEYDDCSVNDYQWYKSDLVCPKCETVNYTTEGFGCYCCLTCGEWFMDNANDE